MKDKEIINWYPGHMAKALREIKELASIVDVFIIVLDARCPISSYNEDFDLIMPHKPRLFVMSKEDLMDKSKKNSIKERFKNEKILWLNLQKSGAKFKILNAIKQLTKEKINKNLARGLLTTRTKAFVMGVPNSGKSTLINMIIGKKNLRVANYPGVTRIKKWVTIEDLSLLDTPGILWPKLQDQDAAIKLTMIGAIDTKTINKSFLTWQMLRILHQYYPQKIQQFANLDLPVDKSIDEVEAYNFFTKISINKKMNINDTYQEFINWIKNLKNITLD